jgi:hypothetical protein
MERHIIQAGSRLAFAFIIIVFGSYIIVAQQVTGTWTARTKASAPDKIHISFSIESDRGGKNQHGSSYALNELEGLSSLQPDGPVSLSLVRDAGTIEASGAFSEGKGSGTFTFIPNHSFADSMRSRGFDFAADTGRKGMHSTMEERLFMAATLNVTLALADDLRSANFPNLGVDDLFKAAIFKIDGNFMREMAATGFPNLSMEDLVKARIFKIDANFVRGIKDMGFGADNFEHLVKYSIFKVTPEFLNDLRSAGLYDLDPEDVVKLRIFKIDAEYVRQARAQDPTISVEKIVQKKIGVGFE